MSTTPEFTIPVTSLDAGGREYRFPIRAAWLRGALEDSGLGPAPEGATDPHLEITAEHAADGTEPEEASAGELTIRASKSGTDIIVHGRLRATLTAECARCTQPALIPIDQPLTALLVPASSAKAMAKAGEYEFGAEEADTATYEGENVVLDDLVRDELLLEVPMIPLCSEDCAGINPGSAEQAAEAPMDEEPGIDPRLAPLLKLKAAKTNK